MGATRARIGLTHVRAFAFAVVIIAAGAILPAACLGGPRTTGARGPVTKRPTGSTQDAAQDMLNEPPWSALGIGLKRTSAPATSESLLVVDTVVPGGAMDCAGIRRSDIIREVARTVVHTQGEAARLFQFAHRQEGVAILVQRGEKVFLTGVYLRPDTAGSW